MSLLDCIETTYSKSLIDKCCDSGVKLPIGEIDRYVILKGEKLSTKNKVCDCIIFIKGKRIMICLIELKKNNMHANEIEEKINNSKDIALDVLKNCNTTDEKFILYPILIYKSIQRSEHKRIERIKISVNGCNQNIITQRCKSQLREIIDKA